MKKTIALSTIFMSPIVLAKSISSSGDSLSNIMATVLFLLAVLAVGVISTILVSNSKRKKRVEAMVENRRVSKMDHEEASSR